MMSATQVCQVRRELRLTADELAKKSGVTPGTISRLEHGKRVLPGTMRRVQAALKRCGQGRPIPTGRDIRAQRLAAGLPQAVLAFLAGIRPESLSRIERGKCSPQLPTLKKIERVLKKASRRRQFNAALSPIASSVP